MPELRQAVNHCGQFIKHKMIQSRFKVWVSILLSCCFVTMFLGFIYSVVTFGKDVPLLRVGHHPATQISHMLSLFWSFVFSILYFALLRKKAVRVTFIGNKIIIQNFLGLGRQKDYPLPQFISFTTTRQGLFAAYEAVNLLLQDGKTIELSEFYHENYKELKAYLETTSRPNLGFKPSNYFMVFMSLFK